MFKTLGGFLGFLVGLVLTVGLILAPHLVPWDFGYGAALAWPASTIALAFLIAVVTMAIVLWLAGRLVRGATSWKQGRVILAIVLIFLTADILYLFLVDLFNLQSGWRVLVAVLGLPIIFGNLTAVLGRNSLKNAMLDIFTSSLTTMGASLIVVALIRGW